LGPLGTFTLRVVQPVFQDGVLLGYVELGKEIEDLLRGLTVRSGSHLAIAINKEHLNRKSWEEGMRFLGREADWDRLPHSVIIYSSHERMPDAFVPMADYYSQNKNGDGVRSSQISYDEKTWQVSAISLPDVSGKEIGYLIVMSDITPETNDFHKKIILGVVFLVSRQSCENQTNA